jgi:hypothetical protein
LIAELPLRRSDDSVSAVATVDADVVDELSQFRWALSKAGYAYRGIWRDGRGRILLLHRVLLGLDFGDSRQVDHINRDKLDNRRSNLRLSDCTRQQWNKGAGYGTSLERGVHWQADKRRWRVEIWLYGRRHCLGRYGTEAEAVAVARAFRVKNDPNALTPEDTHAPTVGEPGGARGAYEQEFEGVRDSSE